MWQFDCNGYTGEQLHEIFKMQLRKKGWGLSEEENTKLLFLNNVKLFSGFGGDTERLTFFAELEHSRDFIANEQGMSINLLTPDHVRRGMIKLRENNIQDEDNHQPSTNPLANMMKILSGKNNVTKIPRDQPKYTEQSVSEEPVVEEMTQEDVAMFETMRSMVNEKAYH